MRISSWIIISFVYKVQRYRQRLMTKNSKFIRYTRIWLIFFRYGASFLDTSWEVMKSQFYESVFSSKYDHILMAVFSSIITCILFFRMLYATYFWSILIANSVKFELMLEKWRSSFILAGQLVSNQKKRQKMFQIGLNWTLNIEIIIFEAKFLEPNACIELIGGEIYFFLLYFEPWQRNYKNFIKFYR